MRERGAVSDLEQWGGCLIADAKGYLAQMLFSVETSA